MKFKNGDTVVYTCIIDSGGAIVTNDSDINQEYKDAYEN